MDQAIRGLFNPYAIQMGVSSQVETHGDDMTPIDKGHSWSDWSEHTSAKTNHANSEYDRYLHDDLFPCDDDSFKHWLPWPMLSWLLLLLLYHLSPLLAPVVVLSMITGPDLQEPVDTVFGHKSG